MGKRSFGESMNKSAFSFLLLFALHQGVCGQSIRVSGSSPTVVLPNRAPWTGIGASGQAMRWEMRIHDFGGQFPNVGIDLGPVELYENQGANWVSPATHYATDSIYNNGAILTGCCQGRSDVLVRVQRDVANTRWTMEICDTVGGNCQTSTSAITVFGPPSFAGFQIRPRPGESVAFLRWFSSAVPLGTAIPITGATGDLGDWEFDGDFTDSSGHGLTMTGGLYAFVPTPTFPPACSAGKSQSFSAGDAAMLDGTASAALDGGSGLSYLWQQLSGPPVIWGRTVSAQRGPGAPSRLTVSDQHSSSPSVSILSPGSYTFQLTVADTSGHSSTCTINNGAVQTGANDVVITNSPEVDALLGPMQRLGAGPWPWFDDRHRAAADVQIANMDVYYADSWNVADPGTVTVTNGSKTVTGVGTTFTTTICSGPSNPTTPKTSIIIWYPTGVAGQTGRRSVGVASCDSDTSLTLSLNWYNSTDVSDGSGLNYSDSTRSGTWTWGPSPANYYDNVAAFYSLYYRSGIVDYLNAARKLADRWWTAPQIDRGASYLVRRDTSGVSGATWPARSISMLGLILRALDGRPDMWPGLRKIMDLFKQYAFVPGSSEMSKLPGVWDIREVAYELSMLSYCAMDDPDLTHRGLCKTAVSNAIAGFFTKARMPDGSWMQSLDSSNTTGSWSSSPRTSVTLTHGSTTVVGDGTKWTAPQFAANATYGWPSIIWFTKSSAMPASNADGDSTYYAPSFVDSTHLMLDRPYEGTTGIHGWMLATASIDTPYVGYGAQPFFEGLLAGAFDYAARAIADSDPTNSAVAREYGISVANWIKTYGYRAATKSVYYGAQSVNCQAPIPEGNNPCTANFDAASARVLNAEALRALMPAYYHTKDESYKETADLLFNAMWAKPGTCPEGSTTCVPDGSYVKSYDDGDGYMTGRPPDGAAPKYFGMAWGFDLLSAWPAYRLGGAQAPSTQQYFLNFDRTAVPSAASVRITVTERGGATRTTSCANSPCMVVAQGLSGLPVKLEYLSAAGAVLRTSEAQLAPAH
jgi:hypothetical protein